nr:hypothetical protein [Tanacetum cinerariifolium]
MYLFYGFQTKCDMNISYLSVLLKHEVLISMITNNDSSRDDDSESDNECRRPTPKGHKYWFLDVLVEEKPTEGDVFDNFDKAYNMYLEYAEKARFSIRKSTTKRKKDENNMDTLRVRRKLDFSDKVFIHRASFSNIGPTRARRLRVAFMGGYHKVCGKPIDWKNFRRSLNKYIGPRDAQMYQMIFVPFTGIDHHQKYVTFVAGLLSDETFESYTWILTDFKQTHGKAPLLAVTDQDTALRKAIEYVFPESHHRLCMWHITQKLPGKVCGDVENDSEFKKRFHKLIWNVHLGLE